MIFSYCTTVASSPLVCRRNDWDRLTHSPTTANLIKSYRAGDANAKKNLPAICFHASFPHGKRKSQEALPSGNFMCDFDGMTPEELKMVAKLAIPQDDQKETSPILLVHITPSGRGLRVVAKATKTGVFAQCESLADYQRALAKQLSSEQFLDQVCTDLARLSFVPQASDVLYINDRLFHEAPEVTAFKTSTGIATHPSTTAGPLLFADSDQESYDGVSLKKIFECYISQTGGIPQEGGRNSRYYSAARDLRYICDFNPRVIARNLPFCGLPESEVLQLCVSACQSSRSSQIPESILRAVATTKALKEDEMPAPADQDDADNGLDVSSHAPLLVREFIDSCPPDFRVATLLAMLPILGTLATRVRAVYLDGELHSPSFFTAITAEQASGKSFARRLVRTLLASVMEEDARERAIEAEYREKLKACKNAKEQPQQPRVKIRIVPATISIAKLLQRLDFAEGDHLFSFVEELDTLLKSNKAGAWSEKNDLYRGGFDNSEFGQDYMSENSYSANLQVFYNLLVLGTPRQSKRFFSDVENGLVSRCCFASLPDQFGSSLPRFAPLTPDQKLKVNHYVKKLREANGEVDLSFTFNAIEAWLEQQRISSLSDNNRAKDIFRRRSAVIGFRAALTISPLYDLYNPAHREILSDFAIFVADLVLQSQMAFAGDELNTLVTPVERAKSNAASIFDSLPDEFTIADAASALRQRNMRTPAKNLIYKWSKNGMVERTAPGIYRKKLPQK